MNAHSPDSSVSRLWMLLLSFLLIPNLVSAQAAAVSPGKEDEDELLTLSPFVVSTEKDNGYVAANTLAGSRLNTALKDTAAAISVFTKEFLSDIGALNTKEALVYALNGGNQFTDLTGSAERISDINVQIRGFVGVTFTRNYFPWVLSGDSFNTERLDFARGPNAILFGIGNPGGIINTTTKRARFGKPVDELQFRVGSWNDYRATVDVNRPLNDKLAVRVNGVWQDKRSWREFEQQRRTAGALAATYRPLKNTELRVEGEYGDVNQVLANPFPAGDAVSSWLAAGKPISSDNVAVVAGTVARPNLQVVYDPHGTTGPVVWRGVRATASSAPIASNAFLLNAFNDESVLPRETNLYGPGATVDFHYYNYSVFLEQKIGALSAELAYNRQYEDRFYVLPLIFNVANLQADPNALLPSFPLPNGQTPPGAGQPNPNAGKFFVESNSFFQPIVRSNKNYRLSLAYDLDFSKKNSWLGKHRLAALASRGEDFASFDQLFEVNITPPGTALYPKDVTFALNRIFRRNYLDFGRPDARWRAQLDPMQFPINNVNGVTSGYRRTANSSNPNLSKTDSWMVATQSTWWDRRVNFTVGLRHDRQKVYNAGTVALHDAVTNEFLPRSLIATPALIGSGYTRTYGVVYHATPWLSLFYNNADNFVPQSVFDVNGNPIDALNGKGQDAGIRFNFWGGRANLSINRYETTRENQVLVDANNTALVANINAIWSAMNQPDKIVSNLARDTVSNAGKGWEVELVANPTKQWRLSANFSQSDLEQSDTYLRYGAYIETNRALWMQNASLPLLTAINLPGIASPTVGDALNAVDGVDWVYARIRASEGKVPMQNVKYTANLFSAYTVATGPEWLKGLMVGGGVNYRGRSVAGYSASRAGAPVYAPGYTLVNFMAGRVFKLHSRHTLHLQVNVNNVLNNDHRLYVDADDAGYHLYRYLQPLSWSMTGTFAF